MNQLFTRQYQIMATLVLACLFFWILLLGGESQLVQVIRTILGGVFILFLPGWRLTSIFFSGSEIDGLERFALSFALSISIIPLLVFYVNIAGIPISDIMIWSVVMGVILSCRIWVWYQEE